MQKEQEIKLAEIKQELEDQRYSNDVRTKEREDIDAEFQREQTRVKSVTEHLEFQLKKLQEAQSADRLVVHNFTETTKEDFYERMQALHDKVDELPQYFKREVMVVNTIKDEVLEKSKE